MSEPWRFVRYGPLRRIGAGWLVMFGIALCGCGRTAREYLNDARVARTLAQKEEFLTRALEKDPSLTEARVRRAWVYALQKKLEPALADYDVLRENTRKQNELASIFYLRGRALEHNGKFAEAVESYTAALRCDPNRLNPYEARAGALFKLGKYADSMADCDEVLNRDVRRFGRDNRAMLAEWRLRHGFAAFCAGEWAAAAEDFQQAAEAATSPVLRARAFLNLYFVECRLGNKRRAERPLKEYALQLLVDQLPGRKDPWIYVAVWFCAGRIDEKRFLEASRHRRPAVQRAQLCGAYYYIGATHLVNGRRRQALAAFQKATSIGTPNSFEYHMAKVETERLLVGGKTPGDFAALARAVKDYQKKIALYTKALRIDPNHTDSLLNRAILFSLTGRHQLALADYSKLITLYKRPSNIALALRYRASTYAQMNQHAKAIRDYTAAIKADPTLWQARHGLAASLCHLRRYREAAKVYADLQNVLIASARKTTWELLRAFALECAGDLAAAAKGFRTVLEKEPTASIVRVHLYIVESKLGNKAAAKQLAAYARELRKPDWENQVAWYAAGMQTEPNFLKASRHSSTRLQLLRTSKAQYYIGAVARIKGDRRKARAAFAECLRLGKRAGRETWEYRLAERELAAE